jgi:hypothetical protein
MAHFFFETGDQERVICRKIPATLVFATFAVYLSSFHQFSNPRPFAYENVSFCFVRHGTAIVGSPLIFVFSSFHAGVSTFTAGTRPPGSTAPEITA